MNSNGDLSYGELIARLREIACRTLPPDSTVAVVSKGDAELLSIEGRRGWHFPQREDGVYCGYHPGDSEAAIAHLEALRKKGAEYLLIPHHSLWWLEHYAGFRRHLEEHYHAIVRDEDTCIIYALADDAAQRHPEVALDNPVGLADLVPEQRLADLAVLFDTDYYSRQANCSFESREAAMLHYVRTGVASGFNPNPLFDTKYYLARYPQVRASGVNPLLHYLAQSPSGGHDPHPWFDTDYYYGQAPGLRVARVNALAHYLSHAGNRRACRPNPLFVDAFYSDSYGDVRHSGCVPLVHYVTTGAAEGRFVSQVHRSMIETLLRSSKAPLLRGQWKGGAVLLVSAAHSSNSVPEMLRLARRLADVHHLEPIVILFRRQEWVRELQDCARTLILEDFRLACDALQPAAFRMFIASLCRLAPLCAFTDTPEALVPLSAEKVPAYFHFDDADKISDSALEEAFRHARRVIFSSSDAFRSAAARIGHYPVNVALRPIEPAASGRRVSGQGTMSAISPVPVLELASRDFSLAELAWSEDPRPSSGTPRTVFIPCCDWSLSGVNSSLEALGCELIRLGWDVQIIFTRSEAEIRKTAGADEHLPKLPYRYLQPRCTGMQGMWEALIAEIEKNAPCILFMGYDFAANGVTAALTDNVGAVAWVQSDDGDYYEQAYRLGRYCNSIVCVSERIKQSVCALNPALAERSTVIYNSSVGRAEILGNRPSRSKKLRLIYTGRLVEYQKRVLDFVELAKNLDRLRVPYQLTLVGEFSKMENISEIFETRAKAHLADGRIRLPGRMTRAAIMKELARNDIFLLLSDFEGLPLSLVEAMAAGCVPVVSEMESGIPEVLASGRNGFVVKGRDYQKWAALLDGLWKDRTRLAALSKQARRTVGDRFTIEHIATQFDRLFRIIVEEIGGGKYKRPPSLHWGHLRSHTGDVLPPQSFYRPPMLWETFGRPR